MPIIGIYFRLDWGMLRRGDEWDRVILEFVLEGRRMRDGDWMVGMVLVF